MLPEIVFTINKVLNMMKLLSKIIGCAVVLSVPYLQAATDVDMKANQVRQEIERTNKTLKERENAKEQTAKSLANISQELKKLQHELNELEKQQEIAAQKVKQLQVDLANLHINIAQTKAKVSRLLLIHYKYPNQNTAVLFLQQQDANEKSRFLHYARYIEQFNERLLKSLKEQQEELQKQEATLKAEKERFDQLVEKQQAKARELGKNRSRTDIIHRQLQADIQNKKDYLAKLYADEQRLLAQLNKLTPNTQKSVSPSLTNADKNTKQNNASTKSTQLGKASLTMPVSGSIQGRFGSKRPDGRPWRGIFIVTAPQAVKAVNDGKVIMVEEEFGQLGKVVGIEHDNGLQSVYAGLSSINTKLGARVTRQQTIGQSGEFFGQTGLYLELIANGVRIDPAPYLK